MSKVTTFSRQSVLSQLVKLMDIHKINVLASKSGANRYAKHLDGYSYLVVSNMLELSVTDRIWELILDTILEIAEMISANASELLYAVIDVNPKFHKFYQMYNLYAA